MCKGSERAKVILTREEEDIEELIPLFEKFNLEVIKLPLIETREIPFAVPKKKPDYIVFQSKKAVKIFLKKVDVPRDTKIVAVGKRTADLIREFGYKVFLIPKEQSAKGICEAFKDLNRGSVWIPRSRQGRLEAIECLKKLGFEVFPINVYETFPKRYPKDYLLKKLKEGDFIVFASPSAVDSFVANLQEENLFSIINNLRIAAIGKTTKNRLIRTELPCHIVPSEPSFEELAVKIHEIWQENCSY